MYPLSSKSPNKKYITIINGKKERTAPTPPNSPLSINPTSNSGAPILENHSDTITPALAIRSPNHSWIPAPIIKVNSYKQYIISAKIGIPKYLFVTILSIFSVVVTCFLLGFFITSSVIDDIKEYLLSTIDISASKPIFFSMVLLLSLSLVNILGAFNCFTLSFIYSSFSKSFKAVQLTGNSNLFLYVSSKEERFFISFSISSP